MTHYQELLDELNLLAEEEYCSFHKKLLKNESLNVLGVRIPALRKIAKKYVNLIDELMGFPDEYYEVTFIKVTAVSLLRYEEFIRYVDRCVVLLDNWATCDCFAPKCIVGHKQDFLSYIEKYLSHGGEFYQRFALTTLLHFYVEENYLSLIFEKVSSANNRLYYVHMASAWLVAETLVKFYDTAKNFLLKETLDIKTHNKAIQKAVESYRLTAEKKNILKGMKR